jgi:hypothetical protein
VVRLDEVDADFFGSVTPLAGLLDALRLLGARGPSGEALG